mgnify:CR=1 FL=1
MVLRGLVGSMVSLLRLREAGIFRMSQVEKLPEFVRSKKDAETLIAFSNRWYQDGYSSGLLMGG